jgi:hypothetical protein
MIITAVPESTEDGPRVAIWCDHSGLTEIVASLLKRQWALDHVGVRKDHPARIANETVLAALQPLMPNWHNEENN